MAQLIRAKGPLQDCWYVARHRLSLADMTLRELDYEGFEVYRPMIERRVRPIIDGKRSSQLLVRLEPLYREYMFVRRHRPGIATLKQITGIEGVLTGAVKGAVIAAHRYAEAQGWQVYADRMDPERARIEVGDTVEVEALGRLVRGVVTRKDGLERVALLVDFIESAGVLVVPLAKAVKVDLDGICAAGGKRAY